MAKPSGLEEYRDWAAKALDSDFSNPQLQRIYETNANNILSSVLQHPFFVRFSEEALRWSESYQSGSRSELFMGSREPNLVVKPFTSVVEKTYRQNVLRNDAFPTEPLKGWVDTRNLYSKINDLVRGTLVCRFIDGPQFVAAQIEKYATRLDLGSRSYSQERDDGYYAFHSYVTFPVPIFDAAWNQAEIPVEVEIQITTQLQDVLRSLTHHLYEGQRLQSEESGKWKWDFASNRFRVGYLSHTLHLIESIILDSRDRVLSETESNSRLGKTRK
jgi:ppGpp synthetase/RelA/SpoT-type nucleotidyltranferase